MGLLYLLGVISMLLLAVINLKGKDVNIPQTGFHISYFLVLSCVFFKALRGRYKTLLTSVALLFFIFSIANLLLIQKNDINTFTISTSAFLLILYCILYYYRLLIELPAQHLHRLPMFWFSTAILIYNSGILFLTLFASYLVNVLHDDLLIYWTFHNILNIIQTLLVLIGLWQDLRNIKSPSL